MPKVKHPNIPGAVIDVPTKDVGAWVRQGWVALEPKRAAPPPITEDDTPTLAVAEYPAKPLPARKPWKPRTPKTPRSATTRQQ